MAITCDWKHKLGEGILTLNTAKETFEYKIAFYGGGNCLFVACHEDGKNLYTFATDVKHAKAFLTKEELGLHDIIIYIKKDKSIDKECKTLAKLFVELSIPFKYLEE